MHTFPIIDRKREVRQRIRSTDVTDVRKKEVRQRIRSTDVTDATDVSPMSVGRRKKEEERRKREEGFLYNCYYF
ncbi:MULTISPECIES: hypothetical protein [unclassified Microcoleus]|uniref:hypothetical protein n=1 Tax=unclassified Microcoleus TaxID=2642155 RepID=UPI002FD59DB7